MEHVASEDKDNLLGISDLVIYGSCLNEQSFPSVLVQAMCLEKLVIAPDLEIIRKYVCSRIHIIFYQDCTCQLKYQLL